jgi:glycosyltransferase involved in cell wall biosynthesis
MTYDIVMLTTVHAATDDRIFFREAKTLAEAGFSVCVIGRHPRSEVMKGIWIDALPNTPSRWKRLILSWKLFNEALRAGGLVYIFHDPELFAAALALRLLGKRVAYDAHENLPMQVLQKQWLPKLVRYVLFPIVYAAECAGSRLLSGVIAAIPITLPRFPSKRTVLVRNFPTASALRLLAKEDPVEARGNIAIYSGGLTRIRGISELVKAFEGLEDAELWLVGRFEEPLFEREIRECLPPNVKYLGFKPFPDVLEFYGFAKIGTILLYPEPNHRHSLPVKLFEYMAAGLPVIISNLPEFSELTRGCGIQVDPRNVGQIRAALIRLFSDDAGVREMSRIARRRVLTEFTWENEGKRLVDFCSSHISAVRHYRPELEH